MTAVRRAGRGRLGGGVRPVALECGVLRVAECVELRAAASATPRATTNAESLIRSSNAVGRAALRAIDAISGKGTEYDYASALRYCARSQSANW